MLTATPETLVAVVVGTFSRFLRGHLHRRESSVSRKTWHALVVSLHCLPHGGMSVSRVSPQTASRLRCPPGAGSPCHSPSKQTSTLFLVQDRCACCIVRRET